MKETKVGLILKQARKLGDHSFAKALRKSALLVLAEEVGILQHYQGTPTSYDYDKPYERERGGKDNSLDLYGLGPKHPKMDKTMERYDRSLSTRYSPDRVGVMARRVSDGVIQDPITNKVYDWNEGFTTEDGEKFEGGQVSLQTDFAQ